MLVFLDVRLVFVLCSAEVGHCGSLFAVRFYDKTTLTNKHRLHDTALFVASDSSFIPPHPFAVRVLFLEQFMLDTVGVIRASDVGREVGAKKVYGRFFVAFCDCVECAISHVATRHHLVARAINARI